MPCPFPDRDLFFPRRTLPYCSHESRSTNQVGESRDPGRVRQSVALLPGFPPYLPVDSHSDSRPADRRSLGNFCGMSSCCTCPTLLRLVWEHSSRLSCLHLLFRTCPNVGYQLRGAFDRRLDAVI